MEEKVSTQREEIVKVTVFPNGVNRVHIPVLSEEESQKRQKRLYDAAEKLLKANERCKMRKGTTV